MKSHTYANFVLTTIAVLLGIIAWQQFSQRPVTRAEMIKLVEAGNTDRYKERRLQMPYVEVRGVEASVDVDVQGGITVDQVVETVRVEVER